jgi:hypothetical protein
MRAIGECAGLPLPDFVDEFSVGQSDLDNGRRDQDVFGDPLHIEVVDPEGRSGWLRIREAFTHPAQMPIEIVVSG